MPKPVKNTTTKTDPQPAAEPLPRRPWDDPSSDRVRWYRRMQRTRLTRDLHALVAKFEEAVAEAKRIADALPGSSLGRWLDRSEWPAVDSAAFTQQDLLTLAHSTEILVSCVDSVLPSLPKERT